MPTEHNLAGWSDSPRPGELLQPNESSAGVVDIWRLDLRQSPGIIENIAEYLTSEERARAARFRQAADFNAFVMTRGVLRQLLSVYLGRKTDAQGIEIIAGKHGKPRLAEALQMAKPASVLEFSVSHSGDFALLGFGRGGALGVDVERVRPRHHLQLVAREHFAREEFEALMTVAEAAENGEDARLRTFYRYWTRKEAYIKAVGAGMAIGLDSFAVSLDAGASLVRSERGDAAAWRLVEVNPDGEHIGAACVPAGNYLRTMTATVSNSASVQLDL